MINVIDVAYGRLRAPDLDKMEKFLTDFGMARSARTETALYMRGTDSDHHIHITELGEPAFVGMGFNAASESDLEKISQVEGASEVEETGEPGGGLRVRMTDPDGLQVDIVHGLESLPPIEVKDKYSFNSGSKRLRYGDIVRSYPRPSQVKRIGHVNWKNGNFPACREFYKSNFGFLTSDYLVHEDESVGAEFLRCNLGHDYSDHHALLITDGYGKCELNHLAFEVEDWNDIQVGHTYLKDKGYQHKYGIGRHILGSQLFDYWSDPWGQEHEHWTDGDLFNEDSPTGKFPMHTARDVQWGPDR